MKIGVRDLRLRFGDVHALDGYAAYQANGMMAEVAGRYPLQGAGNWFRLAGASVIAMFAFALSGWVIGLIFYRQRVWISIALIPLAILPISPTLFTISTEPSLAMLSLHVAGMAIAAVAGFLLVRAVPVRPKKA